MASKKNAPKSGLGSKLRNMNAQSTSSIAKNKILGDIADVLKAKGIPLEDIADASISINHRTTTDKDGKPKATTSTAIKISPTWEAGPKWPVVTQGPRIQIQKTKTKVSKPNGWETAVIVPDIQIGHYRKSLDSFDIEPIHDEQALAVALKVIEKTNPDQVVLVGDNLDFAEFGKYLTAAPFKMLVQAAIDRATYLCAQLREAAPRAKITWIAGNHEARLPRYIQMNAEAAFGLTRGIKPGELREGWPVMTVPYLCRMDEFGIDYLSGYPESAHYINTNLMVVHGDKVVSNNSTTKKYLDNERISVIYGHIHRNEYAYRTRRTDKGPRTIMAASPGCLCRIDGAVPSVKSGSDEFGRPLLQGAENWQQGLGVVTYQPVGVGGEEFFYEPMWIYNGHGIFRGEEYKA